MLLALPSFVLISQLFNKRARTPVLTFILAALLLHDSSAQGTIHFSSQLLGNEPETSPPIQYPVGTANFTLSPEGDFSGSAQFFVLFGLTGVNITDRDRNLIRAASLIQNVSDPNSGAPGSDIFAEWNLQRLTPSETSQLLAGELYVHAPSALRPGDGDVFGQITVVPEPSTKILLGVGMAVLIARTRRFLL